MPRITFLVGLAGCGKTHRADELTRTTGSKHFDGILGRPGGVEEVVQHLKGGGDCTVEELQYCQHPWRESIKRRLLREVPGVDIRGTFFENDLDKANWNVTNRPGGKDAQAHEELNERLTKVYDIPKDVVPEPIYKLPKKRP